MNLPRLRKRSLTDEVCRDWLRELSVELERARRYERPFVLIRVPLEAAQGNAHPADHWRRLSSTVRKVDRCWQAAGSVYLLLPESTGPVGEGLLTRMRETFPKLRLDDAQIACFPDDAVTAGALLDAVHPGGSADASRGREGLPLKGLTPAPELPGLRDASSG
jgi:hypothetical protein